MKIRIARRIGIALAVIVGGLQLAPVDRTNPPVTADVAAPADVGTILRRACYDCHSNETRWRWYSRVAPVSWFVASHVKRGRGDLNFSEWPIFDFQLQELAAADIREQITADKMPLRSYLIMNADAKLSPDDRERLLRWTSSLSPISPLRN